MCAVTLIDAVEELTISKQPVANLAKFSSAVQNLPDVSVF